MAKFARGKELESMINATNLSYRKKGLAVIYNIPLPVKVTNMGIIPLASSVDYIGTISPDGKAIAFDTKETKSSTSLPLSNIHDHQVTFLTYWNATGADAGFLVWFKNLDTEGFMVSITDFNEFIQTETRKSIPYSWFKDEWRVDLNDYLNLFKDNE